MVCFTYVFPCLWEDHCKVGFSKDPLTRLAAFHGRWFESFDLDRGFLIETEKERDARDLELQLRRPLLEHKAPKPMSVRQAAGGHTEWLRGAFTHLEEQGLVLERRGYTLHRPSRTWLATRLASRCDALYSWASAQWSASQLVGDQRGPLLLHLRDALDAHAALDLDVAPFLPDDVARWYFGAEEG
ncbi:MAG: GIY-YIG nuclease family protein [Alphaproteobacteria bacterium]|nr:MAG: GIY-YIG nuclease family protein [Alphaproteobacteria bacterium]